MVRDRIRAMLALGSGLVALSALGGEPRTGVSVHAGSASCRECHPVFHERWETSRHGASVTSVDDAWAATHLAALPAEVRVREHVYRLEASGGGLQVVFGGVEVGRDPVAVEFALGGRDLWYLLGEIGSGRLQVLPVAFDRRREEWFNPAASSVRPHVREEQVGVEWESSAFTFNQSCYTCHVSGLGAAAPADGGGVTRWWDEPGIRCESCHGPGSEHIRYSRELRSGEEPKDLKIIAAGDFDQEQLDGLCGSCHSRRTPLTPEFRPGERLADHFELALLEDPAFYPDGRARGETYTLTSWLGNRCALEGGLDCLHCHTSSGRDRFPGAKANQACLPCHAPKVERAEQHTRHPDGMAGSRCVDCHMPVSEYARMRRHDHSLRAPTPSTTLLMGSPNACNDCHSERDAFWADAQVREWHREDYQAPVVRRARWIERARAGDWTELEDMLLSLETEKEEPLYVASMVRLLGGCEDERKIPVMVEHLDYPSPWVQAAAAAGLEGHLSAWSLPGLLRLAGDARLLVRIRAAQALAPLPLDLLGMDDRLRLERSLGEYESVLRSRLDDPGAWMALGHLELDRGRSREAAIWFERALERDPANLALLVSAGTALYRSGDTERAEARLSRAVERHPGRAVAWSNWVRFLEMSGREAVSERAKREALSNLVGEERRQFVAAVRGD